MDTNAQNLTHAQNQPQTPPSGPAPRPPMPGPSQMGASPRPAPPVRPTSPMPSFNTARPTTMNPAPHTAPAPTSHATPTPTPTAAPHAAPSRPLNSPAGPLPTSQSTQPAAPAPNPNANPLPNAAATMPEGAPAPASMAYGAPTTPPNPMASDTPSMSPNPMASDTPSMSPNPMAPGAAAKPKGKGASKKTLYIILGCLACVVVIACVVAAIMLLKPKAESTTVPNPNPDQSQSQTETPSAVAPLADLDKDALLAAFDTMQEAGYAPEDYVSEEVAAYSASHGGHLQLMPSYADPDELLELDPYGGDYEVNIDQIDDSFAFISALDENGDIVAEEPVFVIFSMDYLIFQYKMDGTPGSGATALTFVDTSEEFIEKAMPILILTMEGPLSSVYDYSSSVNDGALTYHVDFIAVSYDSDEDAEEPYSIGSYYIEFSIDLSSGDVTLITYDENTNESVEFINSYGLTEEEGLDRYELQCENYHFPEQGLTY